MILGKRYNFEAILRAQGNGCLMLEDILCIETSQIIRQHIWLTETRPFHGIQRFALIRFSAIITQYYKTQEKLWKYQLEHIEDVYQLS